MIVQGEIDEELEGQFDDWSQVLGCTINDLRCDISTGVVSNRNGVDGKVYFIAFVWSILIYSIFLVE